VRKLANPENFVVGVDLGGTKIYTAAADLRGQILAEVKIPTEAAGGLERVLGRVVASVRQVEREAGAGGRAGALGIGVPGPMDPFRGVVYQAPNLGWRDVPLKELLEERLGFPVYIDNDANLAALGEHVLGAARGVDDVVYVTVSTGIGGGLILKGELYYGAFFGAGEIGHMTVDPRGPLCRCGNRGCLESLASGTAVARLAEELVEKGKGKGILKVAGSKKITARSVSLAAAAGDPEALAILQKAGKSLGIGLANIVNLLNPALVVLGGGFMQSGPPLWQAMEEELQQRVLPAARQRVRVVPASLGPRSGLLGAVVLAAGRLTGKTGKPGEKPVLE
jgi:glucokinase